MNARNELSNEFLAHLPKSTDLEPGDPAYPFFQIGDRVTYRGAWGGEQPAECTITGVGEHHGRRVYDNDLGWWGYTEQYAPQPMDGVSEAVAAATVTNVTKRN